MPFAFVAYTPSLPKHLRHDRDAWRRCSYCETDRKFLDGRIVLCGDGRLRLIGPDCWHLHIHEEAWHAAGDEWRIYERRERFNALKEEIEPAIREVQASLRLIRESCALSIQFADSLADRLAKAAPELAKVLQNAARQGGALTVERMVPDFGSLEGGRGQRSIQARDDRPPRFRFQAMALHRLAGGAAILPHGKGDSAGALFDLAFAKISKARHRFRETDWEAVSNVMFKREADAIVADCRDAITAVDRALERMVAVLAFFSRENLAGLVRWATDDDCELWILGGSYSLTVRGIKHEPERGEPVILSLPEDYSVPQVPALEKLRRLMSPAEAA